MTAARRVGCWDVSRCVYKARGWRWLWSLVVHRERVCVCLVVSVVFRLNKRRINADHTACAIIYHVLCGVPTGARAPEPGCWWRQSAQ